MADRHTVFISLCIDAISAPLKETRANAFSQLAQQAASGAVLRQTLSKEVLPETAALVPSAACGVFIHGCEDEFYTVRIAAIDALCELALSSEQFAVISFDFLVDMFNDEMQQVRLTAIRNLKRIGLKFELWFNEIQLQTVLLALDDVNLSMRKVGYELLGIFQVRSVEAIKMQIRHLNRNIKRFRKDWELILHCFRDIGFNHPGLIGDLKDVLLKLDPRYLPKEIDLDNRSHIANLIMIFNAGFADPKLLESMPKYSFKQIYFLHAKYPTCFPLDEGMDPEETEFAQTSDFEFLRDSVVSQHLDIAELSLSKNYRDALQILDIFDRQIRKAFRLVPDFDCARFVSRIFGIYRMILKIQDSCQDLQSLDREKLARIAVNLLMSAKSIETNFLGLDPKTRRILYEVDMFAKSALAINPGFEKLQCSIADNVKKHHFPEDGSVNGNPVDILKHHLNSFKFEPPTLMKTIKLFKGSVSWFVEPGLPSNLHYVHFIPVPVHFEGEIWNLGSVFNTCAIIVELDNQKKLIVPIRSDCIQSTGNSRSTYYFVEHLVIGNTKELKCRVILGFSLSNDFSNVWSLACDLGFGSAEYCLETNGIAFPMI